MQEVKVKIKGPGRFKKRKMYECAGEEVLDVGCSFGRYTIFASECGKFAVGLDKECERLVEAKEKGVIVVAADAAYLPFGNDSFDTVLLFDVLEHTPDDVAVLKEAARVARRNILLSVPKSDTYTRHDAGLTYHSYIDPSHLRYYTEESLSEAIRRAGFSDFRMEHFSKVRPALFYRRAGIPVFLLKIVDFVLQALKRESTHFYQTLFAEVRVNLHL